MSAYWIKFSDRVPGCIEGSSVDEVLEKAKEFGVPIGAERLPYPASPRLGAGTDCPSFCYSPSSCAGRSCCPKGPSCVD